MTIGNQTVLITGAGGFIGSHLTEAVVRAGARTRTLVHYNSRQSIGHLRHLPSELRANLEIIFGDIRDPLLVHEACKSCDIVFHLAALIGIPYSYAAPESYLQTNIQGTLNVLNACRAQQVARLLQTSTSEVYGTPQQVPIVETHRLFAQSPYAATKIAADQLALSYHASFDLPLVVVRPFNTYGPRQSLRAVIPTIIAQALAGDMISLGSTSTIRDFLFVSDNVAGYLAAASAEKVLGEVIQLGTGIGHSIDQIVQAVSKIVARPLAMRADSERTRPNKSEVERLVCSPAKAKSLLGWQPKVDFEAGLRQTFDWIAAHRDDYAADRYVT